MAQNILFVNSSARGDYSESRQLGEAIVEKLTQGNPGATVVRLDVSATPPPLVDMDWIMGAYTPAEGHNDDQKAAIAKSDAYVDQLLAADVVVLAVPMYNFGVPAAFKLWIDQVCRLGRTFTASYEGLAKGKKVYVTTARGGGGYGSGQAMESMDFVVPYLRTVLGFIGMTDVTFIDIENVSSQNANYESTKSQALSTIEAIVVEA